VTSDSIAAWLTARTGARLLVLLKDRHGMARLALTPAPARTRVVTAGDLAASSAVDAHLAELLHDAEFDLWALDGEHVERLAELLETGETEGVKLARQAP
jgi:aspartokinase-like uncharacterized kinase